MAHDLVCQNGCGNIPCRLVKTPKDAVLEIYWQNCDPYLQRPIERLLEMLTKAESVSDTPYAFWLGVEGAA